MGLCALEGGLIGSQFKHTVHIKVRASWNAYGIPSDIEHIGQMLLEISHPLITCTIRMPHNHADVHVHLGPSCLPVLAVLCDVHHVSSLWKLTVDKQWVMVYFGFGKECKLHVVCSSPFRAYSWVQSKLGVLSGQQADPH